MRDRTTRWENTQNRGGNYSQPGRQYIGIGRQERGREEREGKGREAKERAGDAEGHRIPGREGAMQAMFPGPGYLCPEAFKAIPGNSTLAGNP